MILNVRMGRSHKTEMLLVCQLVWELCWYATGDISAYGVDDVYRMMPAWGTFH